MTSIAIRKKLHEFIDTMEVKKAKAIFTLFEDEINQAGRISMEQYNLEIDEAIEEVKRGEVFSHDEVVKMAKSW